MTLPGFTEPQVLARLLITDPSNAVSHMFTPLSAPCSLLVDAGKKKKNTNNFSQTLFSEYLLYYEQLFW